jgi:hypothetical protein
MAYHIPDGWPLPSVIVWYTCDMCGMIYGDGNFDQAMLNEYYSKYYGYGVNNPANVERLRADADRIAAESSYDDVIVDFGGAGTMAGAYSPTGSRHWGITRSASIPATRYRRQTSSTPHTLLSISLTCPKP